MSVAFSNQTIKSGYDIRFFLQIQSWSTKPIRIPQDYELCETPGVGNIKYEAVCLAADSLINLKFRPPLIGPMENTGRMVELRYNERFIFEVGVPIEAFPQKGIYKIRSLTKNIFFDGFEGNLVTDWVFVSVQTNHFAPKFYRKGGVWLSLLLL